MDDKLVTLFCVKTIYHSSKNVYHILRAYELPVSELIKIEQDTSWEPLTSSYGVWEQVMGDLPLLNSTISQYNLGMIDSLTQDHLKQITQEIVDEIKKQPFHARIKPVYFYYVTKVKQKSAWSRQLSDFLSLSAPMLLKD